MLVDLVNVASVRHAGVEYEPASWYVVTGRGKQDVAGGRNEMELVYVSEIVQVLGRGEVSIFMRAFPFSLEQLRAKIQANTLHVDVPVMQHLVSEAANYAPQETSDQRPRDLAEFRPARVLVSGVWFCSAYRWEQWVTGQNVAFRPIHLVRSDKDRIEFIFR